MESDSISNGFTVIQHWMVKELHLHGAELFIYAMIHGCSQNGTSVFYGSIDCISEVTDLSRSAVIYALKKLIERKLIIKRDVKDLHEFGIDKVAQGAQHFCVYYTEVSRSGKIAGEFTSTERRAEI